MNRQPFVFKTHKHQQDKLEVFVIKYVLSCILLCSYIISVTTKCSKETCDVCGVCINGSCESKFFADLFESNPPECKIKNHCKANKCAHGKCVSTFGSYYCQCDPGFEGQLCDIRKETENEPSVVEEGQIVYKYILPVLQIGTLILIAKNISPHIELEFVYRANEVSKYESSTFKKNNPQILCSDAHIPGSVCKTLPSVIKQQKQLQNFTEMKRK